MVLRNTLRGGKSGFSSDRAITAKANVVIDLDAQGFDLGDSLQTIANQIVDGCRAEPWWVAALTGATVAPDHHVHATTVTQGDDQPYPCPAAAGPEGQQRQYGVQCVVRSGDHNGGLHGLTGAGETAGVGRASTWAAQTGGAPSSRGHRSSAGRERRWGWGTTPRVVAKPWRSPPPYQLLYASIVQTDTPPWTSFRRACA